MEFSIIVWRMVLISDWFFEESEEENKNIYIGIWRGGLAFTISCLNFGNLVLFDCKDTVPKSFKDNITTPKFKRNNVHLKLNIYLHNAPWLKTIKTRRWKHSFLLQNFFVWLDFSFWTLFWNIGRTSNSKQWNDIILFGNGRRVYAGAGCSN